MINYFGNLGQKIKRKSRRKKMEIFVAATGYISLIGSTVFFFIVLSTMYKDKGFGAALIGFFIPPWTFLWGWLNCAKYGKSHTRNMSLWSILFALASYMAYISAKIS